VETSGAAALGLAAAEQEVPVEANVAAEVSEVASEAPVAEHEEPTASEDASAAAAAVASVDVAAALADAVDAVEAESELLIRSLVWESAVLLVMSRCVCCKRRVNHIGVSVMPLVASSQAICRFRSRSCSISSARRAGFSPPRAQHRHRRPHVRQRSPCDRSSHKHTAQSEQL
jgi:hypothetical protein